MNLSFPSFWMSNHTQWQCVRRQAMMGKRGWKLMQERLPVAVEAFAVGSGRDM